MKARESSPNGPPASFFLLELAVLAGLLAVVTVTNFGVRV
jgi:hypothetical protein